MSKFIKSFFYGAELISSKINIRDVKKIVELIKKIKLQKGRLFFLGVGGSAANCSHAVNDFRKLCNIESYSPVDNVSELTARINDDGWDTSYENWLKISNLKKNDGVFVFSVGGGNISKKVSVNIVKALQFAKKKKCTIFGIVGKDNSFTKKVATCTILVPILDKKLVTPYAESFQALIWHCIVSHPSLKVNKTKW
jgi:D-sedoheptulose 7-phosphate isomerase